MVTDTAPKLDIDKELIDFDDYLRLGTDEEERPKAASSRKMYLWTMKRFLAFCNGTVPSPQKAKEFVKSLEEKGNQPRSINMHIWALKSYLRFKGDPLKIRGLKVENSLPQWGVDVLVEEQWDTLLAEASRPFTNPMLPEYARKRAKLELALLWAYNGGGLRAAEAVGLKLVDVDEAGFFHVHRKGGNEGYVPVESVVIQALKDYIASRKDKGPYVFPGKEPGTHMAKRTAQTIVKGVCIRAGLKDVHVHALRHTAGVSLHRLGAAERDIQSFLGHASIASTKIYTELSREDLARRLPRRFANANQGKLL